MRYQKRCSSDPEPVGAALAVVFAVLALFGALACSAILATLAIGINCMAHHF